MTTRCYGHKGEKKCKTQNSKRLFKAKTQFFFFLNTHTSTRVTLNYQIILYLYIVSSAAKRMHVVCETFARNHKCLIINT